MHRDVCGYSGIYGDVQAHIGFRAQGQGDVVSRLRMGITWGIMLRIGFRSEKFTFSFPPYLASVPPTTKNA